MSVVQDFDRFLISGQAKSAQEVAQLREALRNFLRTWLQALQRKACSGFRECFITGYCATSCAVWLGATIERFAMVGGQSLTHSSTE
ncbi:hypothetical protein [Pseudomonas sp. TWP3-1]|uniref:hypothetical protein n=1 Tax=Pseudomonas sp. TWP3-1 TaxID=2804631 RepID=UPI003CEF67BD